MRNYAEVIESPLFTNNDTFIAHVDEAGTTTLFAKPAFRLSPDGQPPSRPAPQVGDATIQVGDATIEVLQGLGMSDAEISVLLDAGVVSAQQRKASS